MEETVLSVRGLSKHYGKFKVLSDVNLELKSGTILGLCGPNGAGKTTLIKTIVGLLRDYEGEITVKGNKIGPKTKASVSYLPDVEYLAPHLTGKLASSLYADIYPDFNANTLETLFAQMRLDGDMPIAKMSKGMKEKFQLALCLSREADVYIFDEPIAGVDPASRDTILDTILNNYTKDSLLIISTHLITDIEPVLDEVVFLKEGSVYLHENCDTLREEHGKSVNDVFREVFKW